MSNGDRHVSAGEARVLAEELAGEAVSQLFAVSKTDMTSLESTLWAREIQRIGPAAVMAFAEFWMMGGGSSSGHRRAPTINDFRTFTDPKFVSAATALDLLRAEVVQTGPYASPKITDSKLIEAVTHMGGWAKVCQDMPEPTEAFAWKRFGEVFNKAWTRSEGLQVQNRLAPQPLLGLIAAPRQLQRLPAPHQEKDEAPALPAPSTN